MAFIVRTIANAAALWVAAFLVSGIHLGDGTNTGKNVVAILLVAALFGLVNAVVAPVLKVLSLPLIVLTLGIFLLVVNAAMLALTSGLAGMLDLPFHVDAFFWDAILGAVVVSIVGMITDAVLPEEYERR